jgi:hypothetical protein
LLPFFFGCLSGANQPDIGAPYRMNHYQKTVFVRIAQQDKPVFFLGMQGIINGQRQKKTSCGLGFDAQHK